MEAMLEMLANEKDADVDELAQAALADEGLLGELLKGLAAKNDTYRYNCFKVLLKVSENQPTYLYPEWDHFVGLMGSENSYHRNVAVCLLANLTRVDTEARFEDIFDPYFDLLDDKSVITARYVARYAGRIVRSKPHLKTRITERLLGVDNTHHSQGRKDLIKADVIDSFEIFFEVADNKERILAFVHEQLECSSPKTRNAARSFLRKHSD